MHSSYGIRKLRMSRVHGSIGLPASSRRRQILSPPSGYVIVARPAEMLGEHQVSRLSVKPSLADFSVLVRTQAHGF